MFLYHGFLFKVKIGSCSVVSGPSSQSFLICDKAEDKLNRCAIRGPSSAQPFCSGNSIWLHDSQPLGDSAAVDVAGCLARSTAGGLHPKSHSTEVQLCSI